MRGAGSSEKRVSGYQIRLCDKFNSLLAGCLYLPHLKFTKIIKNRPNGIRKIKFYFEFISILSYVMKSIIAEYIHVSFDVKTFTLRCTTIRGAGFV